VLVELVEVKNKNHYGTGAGVQKLEKVFINPEHIVSVRTDDVVTALFREGKLPWSELNHATSFSVVTLSGGSTGTSITVVGAPEIVQKKCFESKRTLLRG